MDRLTQLREYMEKERLDAFYIAKPANVRCISGFTGEDSFLFITKANQYFITDARYTEQASYECPDYELVHWRINFGYSMGKAVAYCADKDGVKTIGFEQDHLTFEKWNSMQAELSAEMVPTLNVIEGFRAIKTPEEIKNLTVACDIASRAFEKIIKDIRPGVHITWLWKVQIPNLTVESLFQEQRALCFTEFRTVSQSNTVISY